MRECPALLQWEPWVIDALRAFMRGQPYPEHLPSAGGIDDQDARLFAALQVLRTEAALIDAAVAQERKHG